MQLDNFDKYVLSQRGKASEIVENLYGHSVADRTAESILSGIRMHIRFKAEIEEEQTKEELLKSYGIEKDVHNSTWILQLSREDLKSPERLMRKHGYDPALWEMVSSTNKAWNVYSKQDGINDLYSSSIRVKPIKGMVSTDTIKDVFYNLKVPELRVYKHINRGNLLELPIMDLHLGKLAWAHEVGEDFDLKIASELYMNTIEQVIYRLERNNHEIERILFPIGNDFFHYDNPNAETTQGTKMDTDSRWPKMYKTGTELLTYAIEHLRKIAPVKAVYIPSNHDEMLSYAATLHCNARFHKVDDVDVDIDNTRHRKYHMYGNALIGLAHGYKERTRIKFTMQDEADEMWGQTKFRELHLAHLHTESVVEIPGMKIRRVPSVTSIDRWHEQHGYHSLRQSQAFVWTKDCGLDTIMVMNVVKEVNCETGEIR